MLESAANDAKIEDNARNRIGQTLKQLRKEEDVGEARALLEDMQQTVDEAEAKAFDTERRLYREIEEYMCSWDQELDRPQDMSGMAQQIDWNESTKTTRFWTEKALEDSS